MLKEYHNTFLGIQCRIILRTWLLLSLQDEKSCLLYFNVKISQSLTSLLFSSAFGLFNFLKTSKRAKMTPHIDAWILVAENMNDALLWFTNDMYHCRQEQWSYFPLFLNVPCFDLHNFYATGRQSIVTKMFLNVLIRRFLIKKASVCKNQSNNITKRFFVILDMKSLKLFMVLVHFIKFSSDRI